MDLGTIGGMLVTCGLILAAILLGGSIMMFVDIKSILIVFGGTAGALCIAFPMTVVKGAVKSLKVTIKPPTINAAETVKTLSELSRRARRDGLLSLEEAAEQTEDDFLQRGLRMMVDGHEPSAIESVLYDEIGKIDERHKACFNFWDTIGAYGPGMGLIGTLVGLVQMLQAMDDPKAIGPAMAVALLTTFYGALLANVFGVPIGAKLKARSGEELAHKELIAQGLISILGGENPRFMVERLNATLPPAEREEEAA